ncbi:MAG: SDR family oxidoreductase [Thalassobaculales bacterium]
MADYARLFDLAGKVAVVTGAAGNLGPHFCAALKDHGARVVAVDLAAPALNVDLALACDVADPDAVAAMVKAVLARFGRIDVLHNNAASKGDDLAAFFEPAETYSLATWRAVMAVNLDGLFLVAQAVGRAMAEAGGGSIIQTGSIYGAVGPDPRIYEGSHYLGRQINTPPVYSASKAGLAGLTRHLATIWGPRGVRVNTLTLGGVATGQNSAFTERYAARVPLGRMARPQDVVGALVWLASDASAYVTGQNIMVDGGWTAW